MRRLMPEGVVFVRKEDRSARSEAPVPAGVKVELTAVSALRLRVRPRRPSRNERTFGGEMFPALPIVSTSCWSSRGRARTY